MAEKINKEEQNKKPKDKLSLINYKKIIKLGTMVIGLAMIAFMTLAQITFDPNQFDLSDWFSNTLIMIGISIFSLLMGESIGADKQENNPFGLYQYCLKMYKNARDSVEKYAPYFSGYYIIHNEKELAEKKANFLIRNGFDSDEAIVLSKNLKEQDLEIIFDEAIERCDSKGRKVNICKIDPSKREIIEEMLNITIDVANYSYFLTANNKSTSLGIAENSIIIPKKRSSSKTFNRLYKLITSTIFSIIWAMFTVKEFANGDNLQAWMNLITRVVQITSSFLAGWGSATIDIKLASDELENKTLMLKEYNTAIENNDYIPETYQQRFEREIKEKQEKNVISNNVEEDIKDGQKAVLE